MHRISNAAPRSSASRRTRGARALLAAVLALATALVAAGSITPGTAHAATPTVVTLTFDDGHANQYPVKDMLSARGMKATFYANSGRVNLPDYLTTAQLQTIQAEGNEIAGHTVSHADLPTLGVDEQKRQVCDDRVALSNMGLRITNFAYPFGDFDATTKSIVAACGYNSARVVGGLPSFEGCANCEPGESIPPADPFAIQTPASVKSNWTLANLTSIVTNAENNGGAWVPFLMHDVCDGCSVNSISPTLLGQFMDWLQTRISAGTVVVKTVDQVIGGPVRPLVSGPTPPPPAAGPNVLINPSLESSTGGVADCWQHGGFGTNTTAWSRSGDAHTGSWAEQVTMSAFTDGDVKLVSKQDLGACAPVATTGHTYDISTWYKSTAPVRIVTYYRTTAGGWVFWAQSPTTGAATNTYTKLAWTTPAFPAGATGISIGLSLRSVGSMTTDDWSLGDSDQTAPTVALTQPTDGAVLNGTAVPFSATASDASGIAKVEFLVNGTVRGTVTTAPYTFAWNSTTFPDGSGAVAARATDTAGNVTTSSSVLVDVVNTGTPTQDTTPPVSSITCNGAGCTAGFSNAPVSVALSASDSGSGVAAILYTTDGSDPRTNGVAYTAPFTVPASATVLYSARDVQGNVESPKSQAIRIDTVAPVSSITCNGTTCAATAYSSPVQAALSATDAGSGVASIRYTTDGSDPTTSSAAYSAPFSVGSTTVVKYRAFDTAGNAEATRSQTITTAAVPVSTIVTLGFDDSVADQAQVPALLDAHGMKGTFFVNSGEVGGPGYMTWPQIDGIATDGHEIAGHTLHHPHLTTLSATDQQTEICQDRQNLLARGYNVTNFAYPYGEGYDNATTRSIVQGCGYSSARMAWGLWYDGCDDCVYADTVPPTDKWATLAGDSIQDTHTLADIEAQVTRAEQHGGGWLQLVFHHVCANDCDQYSVTPANLAAFLDWLQARSAQGTVVKTTQQVLGGTVTPPPPTDSTAPTSSITCNNAACSASGYRSTVAVRLTAADNAGGSGVNQIKYTTNGADPRTSGTVYTAPFNVTSTKSVRFSASDKAGNVEAPQSVNLVIDTTAPTSTVTCNGAACTSGWYKSGTVVALTATDAGSGVAGIRYTTNGADPRTSGTTYTGPFTLNATATVRSSATDKAGNVEAPKSQSVRIDTVAPKVTLTAPKNGTRILTGLSTGLTATASDTGGSGVASVRFFVDGAQVATDTSSPYSSSWKVTRGSHTVWAVAIDAAGNSTTTASVTITGT